MVLMVRWDVILMFLGVVLVVLEVVLLLLLLQLLLLQLRVLLKLPSPLWGGEFYVPSTVGKQKRRKARKTKSCV